MSQDPEPASLADALQDAAAAFKAPDTVSLHGAAVRRGRQIKRRRAGAAIGGGAAALGMAGVLAFTLSAGAGHGTVVSAASGSSSPAASPPSTQPAASPSYPRATTPPTIRSGAITGTVMQDALEYELPSNAQIVMAGGYGNANVEVVSTNTHSWYAQGAVTIKSSGEIGTTLAISAVHTAGSDTCATLNQGRGDGRSTCTQTTLDGGKLLDQVVPVGVLSSDGVFEFFEWYSPAGYETDLELQDSTLGAFAVTKAQAEAILTSQIFGSVAQVLPADACVGGSFSNSVDPPSPGQSPLQHVRCSTNKNLYPTY